MEENLYGFIERLNSQMYEKLIQWKYPSLYSSTQNYNYIIYGPLSLVNHSDNSYFGFKKNSKQLQLIANRTITIKNREITANYGKDYF